MFDFFLVLLTEIIGLGTLVWIRFRRFPPILAAYEHEARPRALLHEAEVRRSRGDDPRKRAGGGGKRPAASAGAASPIGPTATAVPIEIRRFGVGHRRPDGPPGSVGLTGQVIHSDGRGVIAELAFARGARIEPHANPNTTWFIVIEGGGWVGVGDERTRIAAGEAVRLAGRHPARGLDRALRDARVRRRVRRGRRRDGGRVARGPRASRSTPRTRTRSLRGVGTLAEHRRRPARSRSRRAGLTADEPRSGRGLLR